jgi:hypothetical protein
MDKKLLLALQSICNDKNLKLPWDEVGESMDEKVSGGAIIQHLAKIRQRQAAQGIKVPPPLRRGGGNVTSTSGVRKITKGTSAGLKKMKSRANSKSENEASETEDEDTDVNGASDFEGEIDSWRPKNVKHATKAKERGAGLKEADNEGKEQEDDDVASKAGNKRKRGKKLGGPLKRKSRPTTSKTQKPKGDMGKRHARSSVTSSNTCEDSPNGNETRMGSDEDEQQDPVGRRYLAVGASFFDGFDQDKPLPSRENNGEGPSRVEVLRLGKSERAKALLQGLHDQEQASIEAEAESIASSDPISIARLDGGEKSMLPGDEASPKIAEMSTHSVASGNTPGHSQGYAHQRPMAPLAYEKRGNFYATSGANSVGLGGSKIHNERSRSYVAPELGVPQIYPTDFRASSYQHGNSMSAALGSMHFEGPMGYSAHMSQQTSVAGLAHSKPNHYGLQFSDHYANHLVPGTSWSRPQAFDQTESQMLHGFVSGPVQGYSGSEPYGMDSYSRESYGIESHHRNVLFPVSNQDHVRPTGSGQKFVDLALSRENGNTVPRPDLLAHSIAEGQDFLSGNPDKNHQQVQGTAATTGSCYTITTNGALSPGIASSPDNTNGVQLPNAENSDEVIWSDFLVDFDDSGEAQDTNLTNNISSLMVDLASDSSQ